MKKNSIDIVNKPTGKSIPKEDMKMKVREYIDKLNDSSTRDLIQYFHYYFLIQMMEQL